MIQRVILAMAMVGSFSCSESSPPCGTGQDGVPPLGVDSELNTYWIASVGISENETVGTNASHATVLMANFSDFSHYQVEVAQRFTFSEACFVYSSRPVVLSRCQPSLACGEGSPCLDGYVCLDGHCLESRVPCSKSEDCPEHQICEVEEGLCASARCGDGIGCAGDFTCVKGEAMSLHVDRVTFQGLAGGNRELVPNEGENDLPPMILDGRAFLDPNVNIEIVAEQGERQFPAFSDSLAAPAAPKLRAIGQLESPDLSAGPSIGINAYRDEPLRVEWVPAGGDVIEIKLIPGSGTKTDYMKLRCITFDDGCLEIPAEAIHYLALDECTNFRFRLERHNMKIREVKEGEELKAAAVLDLSSELEATVLR
jgi:hypothetical protein